MASQSNELYQRAQVGLKLLWANRIDEAEEFFDAEKDVNPRFALHHAETSICRTIITELTTDRDESTKRMNNVIKMAEKQIKMLENNTSIPDKENLLLDAKVILADAHILLAGLLILEESRVKGVLTLRKGWKLYKQVLATIPSLQQQISSSKEQNNNTSSTNDPAVVSSLKFGAGLFFFILSFIPPGVIQKAAALAGFSGGNKELGLQFLADTRNTPFSVRGHLANIVLALNLLIVTPAPDDESTMRIFNQADQYIVSGLQDFPSGSVFQATAALALLEANKPDEALKLAEQAINNSKHITDYPAVFLRLQSNCYAMAYNWQELGKVLQKIVDLAAEGEKQGKFKNPWSLTWNSIRLAACLNLLGQQDKAKKIFSDVSNAKKMDKWSETVIQLASKYLKNGGYFSNFEIMHVTQHYEKSLKFASEEKKNKMIALLDSLAAKASGALTPLSTHSGNTPRGIRDLFASKSQKNLNDPKLDNRVAYLTLKGTALRYIPGKETEALECFNEVIEAAPKLTDKMFYAISLIQLAKMNMKSAPEQSIKQLKSVLSFDFMFDSGLKSQARAYIKYLVDGNSALGIGFEEEPSSPITEEELDESQAAKEIEKLLNDQSND